MKTFKFIFSSILIITLISCNSREKHINNKNSISLNSKAMRLVMFDDTDIKKVDSAIVILNQAIKIDPKYIEARMNIIRFLVIRKNYKSAFKNCRDLQKYYPESPLFITLEGGIYFNLKDKENYKRCLKRALEMYETELLDEVENDANLEIEYIQCLASNNRIKEAKKRLELLKMRNKSNLFYKDLTLKELMGNETKKSQTK